MIMGNLKKAWLLLSLLTLALLISGCVTIDEHIKVNKNAEIDRFQATLAFPSYTEYWKNYEEGDFCKDLLKEEKITKKRSWSEDGDTFIVIESEMIRCQESWLKNDTVIVMFETKKNS